MNFKIADSTTVDGLSSEDPNPELHLHFWRKRPGSWDDANNQLMTKYQEINFIKRAERAQAQAFKGHSEEEPCPVGVCSHKNKCVLNYFK